jgi:Metallopeptidase family M24
MRASCRLLEMATQALVETWRQRHEPETAALEAERLARSFGAQDVRTLVSLDGGRTLVPFAGRFEKKSGALVGYLAVKMMGYWADLLVTQDVASTHASRHAEAALDALIGAVRPGVRAGDLYAKATAALGPFRLHQSLSGSVGHGIGLSLNEQPEFRADSDAVLAEDGIDTLQVGLVGIEAGNVLLSAVVRNAGNGAEVLVRTPPVTPA